MSEELEGYEPEEVPYVPYASPPQQPPLPPSLGSDGPDSLIPVSSVLPSPPTTPIISDSLPARKKSRRGPWIIMSIIVVLLLLASVASFFVIRSVNHPTAGATLDVFCNALLHQDYQSAYGQFSNKLQSRFSEATFARVLSEDKVTVCTHGAPEDAGSSMTANLKLVHASGGVNNDVITLTKDGNSDWKIDDVRQANQ